MHKLAVRSVVALLFVLSLGIYIFAQAPQKAPAGKPPGNLPGTFTFIPKADVEKVQQAILNGTPNDSPVRMVNANRFDFGVYTLNYAEASKPHGGGKANTRGASGDDGNVVWRYGWLGHEKSPEGFVLKAFF